MNKPQSERSFSTSMGGLVVAISVGIFALIVVVALLAHAVWIAAILVTIVAASYVMNPMHYTVTNDALRIYRPIGTVVVPLSSIQHIQKLATLPYIRLFGIGGLFGYYGLYWSKATGTVRMFGRNRSNLVLLVLQDGRQIVIMPDDLAILESLPKL